MKLGSLFDGSGGFPLAGALNGVKSVWCSEIEPYPIAVTRSRFPNMKHYGDVSKVNGTNIEPVDIITFGSPCQDLSIAGKREGIEDGARSSLFFQALRIIKEMREETNGAYPRFAVWENVPGAFSSNKGNDFRLVLEALANVSDQEISIPMPEKWQRAGEIIGDGWSIAWRILDAQYWGVPQRRKRIYLVADFGSERAGEILFEPESVRGDTAPSGTARKGITDNVEGSAGRSGVRCLNSDHPQSSRIYDADGVYPCLSSNASGGLNRQAVCYPAGDAEGSVGGSCGEGCLNPWDCQSKRIFTPNAVWPTLPAMDCGGANNSAVVYAIDSLSSNSMKSNNPHSGFHAEEYAKCLDTSDQNPSKNQGGNVVVYPINLQVITRHKALGRGTGFGAGEAGDAAYTLQAGHEHGVVYALQTNGIDHADTVGCYQDRVGALCATDYKWVQQQQVEQDKLVVYSRQRSDELREGAVASCQNARQYKDATDLVVNRGQRKYIVRRLTPTECARLQGFPDAWGELAPYDGDDAFWWGVYKTACEIKGSKCPPKKDLHKWYAGLRTDSAEYKMWGNGIALPCAEFVIRSIVFYASIK